MPYNRLHARQAQGKHQRHGILNQVDKPERSNVTIVPIVPARGLTIAALIGRYHAVASLCQRKHQLAPAIGQFGKPMQQQDGRPGLVFEAGFKHMHLQPIHVTHDPGAHAGGQLHVRGPGFLGNAAGVEVFHLFL